MTNVAPAPVVFLYHASEDKADFAEPLGRKLASLGIRSWPDKWEIQPGESLVQKLFDEGVAYADAVIVVVSQYSAGKRWARAELDAAMVRKITEDTRLIPVRLDGAECAPRSRCSSGTTPQAPRTGSGELPGPTLGMVQRPSQLHGEAAPPSGSRPNR